MEPRKSPLHLGSCCASIILLLGLAVSCKSNPSTDKADAGQRKYCNSTLVDGGFDTTPREGGMGDLLTNSPELGSGGDGSARDSLAVVIDGPVGDLRGASGEVAVVDSGGGVDVASSDAPNGVNDVGGIGGSGGSGGGGGSIGNGDVRGLDGTSDTRGDGGVGAAADHGPPDLLSDVRADAQTGVFPDVQADAPAARDTAILLDVVAADTAKDTPAVVDLASDVPAGTCSTGGANWASDSLMSLLGLAVSLDGTEWATGDFYASVPDFGAGTPLPHASDKYADAFLVKLDPSSGLATEAFSFSDPGGNEQDGTGVAVAQSGNVGVIGQYSTEIDFTAAGSDTGTSGLDYMAKSSLVAGALMNYYIVVDGTSSGQYVTPIRAHSVDMGTGALMAVASNPSQNAFAICGKTSRLLATYTATNTGLLTGALPTYGGGKDIVVAKIDAGTGNVLWGQQFGGAGDQICEAVAMDNNGDVIVGGNYTGTLNFSATVTLPVVADTTVGIIYVAKLASADGSPIVAATWGTTGRSDVYGLAVDSSGNIILAGSLGANVTFGSIAVNDLGLTDAYVVKLNSSLVPQWAESFGDANYDQAAKAVGVSSTGNVFIGGA
ncbi:MAG: hypothetical protein ABSF35_21245, partial [Polyangia bacterium]